LPLAILPGQRQERAGGGRFAYAINVAVGFAFLISAAHQATDPAIGSRDFR
jgi:hypothetical protein